MEVKDRVIGMMMGQPPIYLIHIGSRWSGVSSTKRKLKLMLMSN